MQTVTSLLTFLLLISIVAAHEAYSYQKVKQESHGGGHEGGGYEHVDYYSHPKYKYDYGVSDHKSGDDKEAYEERDGDKVKGGYKLKEADGTYRVVEYTADKHKGFNAVVKRIGHAKHPISYKKEHESYGGLDGGFEGYEGGFGESDGGFGGSEGSYDNFDGGYSDFGSSFDEGL